jgi:hypothetical protein
MVFKIPETRKASAKGEGEKKFSNSSNGAAPSGN